MKSAFMYIYIANCTLVASISLLANDFVYLKFKILIYFE